MPLTKEEAAQLKALQEKAKTKDEPAEKIGKVVNVSIDLGDPEQVKRGQELGLLAMFEENGDGEGDGEGDGPPKRNGFFDE